MRTTTLGTLAITLGILQAPPALGDDWTLRRHETKYDIAIYERKTPEGYTEFRGITHMHSRLNAFVALFRDVGNMPNWLYRTREVTTLDELSATENYSYTINEMPWPLKDRDSVVHATLTQDADTHTLTLRAVAAPHYRPENERYIRIPVLASSWIFTPLQDGRTQIEFRGYADPGGQLSSGLLGKIQAMLVWQAPYKTLRRMRDYIGDAKYQSAKFAFVEEPMIWQASQTRSSASILAD